MITRLVPVAPVRRRPSRLDPPVGSWALIGHTVLEDEIRRAFGQRGIPLIGYDRTGTGREVISVDEIDDVDSLSVTSRDVRSGEIHTDYFAGVVCCLTSPESVAPDFAAPGVFSPFHPAFITPRTAGDAEESADYARQLAADPRTALARHRHACGLE